VSHPRNPGWRPFATTKSAPLVQLRFLFANFVLALVVFLVFLSFVIDPQDQRRGDPEPDWALRVQVAGLATSLLGAGWARGRSLSGTTSRALASSYTRRFFIGIGFADSAALLGVVIAFVTNRLWPYFVGLAVSLVGFALMAPTARNIERDEERLRAAGSSVSLWDGLTRPPDPSVSGNR
jgi:F0F1-type ATP synthase membrane subunit c/vacuolar-type H+-ATPase subunit K